MLSLTLSQMRHSIGRLTAAGIAVLIGTAFVAATLLAGNVMRDISYDSATASLGSADLAVLNAPITDEQLDAVRAQDGVAAADPQVLTNSVQMSNGDRRISQSVLGTPSARSLDTQNLTSGAWPEQDGQITLPEAAAERLDVQIGDGIDVTYYTSTATSGSGNEHGATNDATVDEPQSQESTDTVTVVGLTTDPNSAWSSHGGAAQSTVHDALVWAGATTTVGEPRLEDAWASTITLTLADGADLEQVRSALTRALVDAGAPDARVLTRAEAAEASIGGDGASPVTMVVLSFAAIALLVAGLVISNTFQVLVAQRTRTLALLRCVGAVRSQVRRSVLTEAGLLGLVASVAGVLVGTGLVQLALWGLQSRDLPFPVPSTVTPTVASVLAPLVVGVLVTVVAALSPARAATRVAPVAALRPVDAPAAGTRTGKARLALAGLLVVGGVAALLGGMYLAHEGSSGAGVLAAVAGGALSFVGLLVSAVFWMPKVVSGVGSLVGRLGMPARLAAANTGRNPARTAATSTALLIGVTLVAMMSTGAATARATLDAELDSLYPVDVQVSTPHGMASADNGRLEPLPVGTADRLAGLDGVAEAVSVPTSVVRLASLGAPDDYSAQPMHVLTPAQAAATLRDTDVAGAVADDTAVIPRREANWAGLEDGDRVLLGTSDDGSTVARTVRVADVNDSWVLVTPATAEELGAATVATTAWLRLVDVHDSASVMDAIEDMVTDTGISVTGAAAERAVYQRAIDTVLAVVVGLLAVAVVIALVGVTNTLSLSVIERRRESATLRALGLTRRRLRASLAVEGALIAGVGAVVGMLLGLAYGWAGSYSVLTVIGSLELRVPWADLGLVLGVALVAGVLASVVPARSAARTPPVAALAEA